MPVVACPKCPTKLRVPDGATGKVKCPKCATLFPVSAPTPSAAFEVVEDEPPASPPPPPKSAARPKAVPPAPLPLPPPPPTENQFTFDADAKPKKKTPAADAGDPPRKKNLWEGAEQNKNKEDEEDEDDRPRNKRRRDDDDDDDDGRPRKKRRRDDDEDEEDRPRSKRRRDDDDDDDDRPRKKRRRDDDDDDDNEDDWHRPPKKKGPAGFAPAKTGVLLLNISLWLYLVSLGLISFMIFLGWVGAFDSSSSTTSTTTTRTSRGTTTRTDDFGSGGNNSAELLVKLPGILGITNWIIAGVGFGFCIAGPKQSRGLAITAASLAGAHLLLAGISIDNVGGMVGRFGTGSSSGTWILWATTLPILDTLLPVIIMGGAKQIGTDYVFALLAGGCELARLIFALLMVKAMANAAKDYDAEEKAQMGVMAAGAITGATVALGLLLALLAKAEAIKGFNVIIGSILLVYVGFTAMTLLPILATNVLRRTLARKAR